MSLENLKVIYKRYQRSITPEQMAGVREYSTTLTSPRLLEYKLFNETVAFDVEISKTDDVILFSIADHDFSITELAAINERINIFVSESLDPEMYH